MNTRFTLEDYRRILLALCERENHYKTAYYTVPGLSENKALRKEVTAYGDLFRKVNYRRAKLQARMDEKAKVNGNENPGHG